MSRYLFISGHQIDAVKEAIALMESTLASKEGEYLAALKRYQDASVAKRRKADEVGHPHSSGWWNRYSSLPVMPDLSGETATLQRLRRVVLDFEKADPEGASE